MWGRKIRRDAPRYPVPENPFSPSEPIPSSGRTYKPDPIVEDAKHRMADEMERGRTPYNFSGELSGGGGGFSPVATASTVALVAALVIGFFAWKFLSGVSGKMDNLNRNMASISAQLQAGMEAQEAAGRALVRSELRKTLVSLDAAISLGDPAVTGQAMKLRDEVKSLLNSIDAANIQASASVQPGRERVAEPPLSVISPAGQLESKADTSALERPAATAGQLNTGVAKQEDVPAGGESSQQSPAAGENVHK